MDIAFIYFCNCCEKYGWIVLTNIYTDVGNESIAEQIHHRKNGLHYSCYHCKAQKQFLKHSCCVHVAEVDDVLADLEHELLAA